jgi:carbon-monoxide dehydrogenase medium subunit
MKPAPFKYYDPPTLDEALSLLAELENSKILAGGQSLMPMLNFRYMQPDHLIDLNKIAELAGAEVKGQALHIGAMTRQCELERSPIVAQTCPMLPTVLAHVGHRQTRNRGTIGGSLCHLDPSAELVNCVSAHDGAHLVVGSARGLRVLAFSEFALGYMTHSLQADEILLRVVLPFWSPRHGYGFMEVAPRKGDFALAAVGAMIELDGPSGTISRASISVSGASQIPTKPEAAERLLVGEPASADLFRAAADSVVIDDPLSDSYATSDYRCHLARVLTRRALAAAADKAAERWANV